MSASNWVTRSSGASGAVDQLGGLRGRARTAAAKSASDTGSSPTSIRSRNEPRCGEV